MFFKFSVGNIFISADHCVCSWNWKRPARFYLYRLIVTILQITFVIMVWLMFSDSSYKMSLKIIWSIWLSGVFQSPTDFEFENQFYQAIKHFQSPTNANKGSTDKNARRKLTKYFFFDGFRHANRLNKYLIKSRLFLATRAPDTAGSAWRISPVCDKTFQRGNSSDGQKIIRQHSGTGSYHAKDLTTTSNYDVQKMVENWVTKTQEM